MYLDSSVCPLGMYAVLGSRSEGFHAKPRHAGKVFMLLCFKTDKHVNINIIVNSDAFSSLSVRFTRMSKL